MHRVNRIKGDVRSHHNVFQLQHAQVNPRTQQRIRRLFAHGMKRQIVVQQSAFIFQNVQSRAPDFAGGNRFEQRFGVNQFPARRVDDDNAFFHFSERVFVEQVIVFFGQWAVKRENVRFFKHFIQRHILESDFLRVGFVRIRVVRQNVHLEAFGNARGIASDCPRADDTDCPSAQVESQVVVGVDVRFLYGAVRTADFAGDVQQQTEREFCNRRIAVSRNVANVNAVFFAIIQIDVVKARGAQGNQLQIREFFQHLRADVNGMHENGDDFRVRHFRQFFVGQIGGTFFRHDDFDVFGVQRVFLVITAGDVVNVEINDFGHCLSFQSFC